MLQGKSLLANKHFMLSVKKAHVSKFTNFLVPFTLRLLLTTEITAGGRSWRAECKSIKMAKLKGSFIFYFDHIPKYRRKIFYPVNYKNTKDARRFCFCSSYEHTQEHSFDGL